MVATLCQTEKFRSLSNLAGSQGPYFAKYLTWTRGGQGDFCECDTCTGGQAAAWPVYSMTEERRLALPLFFASVAFCLLLPTCFGINWLWTEPPGTVSYINLSFFNFRCQIGCLTNLFFFSSLSLIFLLLWWFCFYFLLHCLILNMTMNFCVCGSVFFFLLFLFLFHFSKVFCTSFPKLVWSCFVFWPYF